MAGGLAAAGMEGGRVILFAKFVCDPMPLWSSRRTVANSCHGSILIVGVTYLITAGRAAAAEQLRGRSGGGTPGPGTRARWVRPRRPATPGSGPR
eukprot:767699-Hanusia_phi.AAC.2